MSIAYSQLYVALKIVKSILHNMKSILINRHVIMSVDTSTLFSQKSEKLAPKVTQISKKFLFEAILMINNSTQRNYRK